MSECNELFESNHRLQFTNIMYDIDSIIFKLKRSEDKDEVKRIILNQHYIVFNYDNLVNGNREGIQELFMNLNFLEVMDNISGLLEPELQKSEIIFINKIIYDFFEYAGSINGGEVDKIRKKLMNISYNINIKMIRALSTFIGVNAARNLSIIARSSYKNSKVIHRVNRYITISDLELNENSIATIYDIIYHLYGDDFNIKNITDLFTYTMLEYDCDDPTEDKSILAKFNMISSVMMKMLNNLSFDEMNIVLNNYTRTINLIGINSADKLRFSIKDHITSEYMINCISKIEEINNITIY